MMVRRYLRKSGKYRRPLIPVISTDPSRKIGFCNDQAEVLGSTFWVQIGRRCLYVWPWGFTIDRIETPALVSKVKVKTPGRKPWVFYNTGGDLINDLRLALYAAEAEQSHG